VTSVAVAECSLSVLQLFVLPLGPGEKSWGTASGREGGQEAEGDKQGRMLHELPEDFTAEPMQGDGLLCNLWL
jgi:hypothetical protein